MNRVLTFDLGTTYFKICLFDDALQLVARQRMPVPVERPASDRAELPVATFCRCLTSAVHDISRQTGGLRNVANICFASQANSFTLLDSSSRALVPFLLWSDGRASRQGAFLRTLSGDPDFYAATGVAQLNHHLMVAKIRWLQEHRPTMIARARRLCCMNDYFVWWLTGNHLTEAGLAGLTGLVDIHRLEYRADALRHAELPIEWLPKITRAGADLGQLRSEITHAWGLPSGCRLIMGCLDQYAGAIGAGNTAPGNVSETTGTVLATVRCARDFTVNATPGVFQGPASAPGTYYQMVFSSLSAGLLEKYRNQLPDRPSFAELDQLAAQVPPGADGLRLHAEATLDSRTEMFSGRVASHDRGHEARAIMEAVAFELRRQVSALCGDDWPSSVRAAGGAARSSLWLQIKSQVLGCPVQAAECMEPTGLGAACLAERSRGT